METHFGDRLVKAIREKDAPVCVGLDPLIGRFPPALLNSLGLGEVTSGGPEAGVDPASAAEAMLTFGREVIQIVAPYVPVIKINIAFFERYHADGVRAHFQLVKEARQAGLIVIGDVKRADIGHSATQYAYGQLAPPTAISDRSLDTPDAVTVNPYFGYDAIRPFVEVAREAGRGLFVLVQTSNESAGEVQGLTLCDGSKLCEHVAQIVQSWSSGAGLIGSRGYSCIGAVVSPRDLESTERIRTMMPNCIFLVPGFGAQGRTGDEVARCFKPDRTGAIVNASRSVIYAYQSERYHDACGDDWQRCIELGCKDFVSAVRSAL
jgi:orotidine-5'-phosphate decarboxylase